MKFMMRQKPTKPENPMIDGVHYVNGCSIKEIMHFLDGLGVKYADAKIKCREDSWRQCYDDNDDGYYAIIEYKARKYTPEQFERQMAEYEAALEDWKTWTKENAEAIKEHKAKKEDRQNEVRKLTLRNQIDRLVAELSEIEKKEREG